MNSIAKTVLALAAALLAACGEAPDPKASGSLAAGPAGLNQEELAAEAGAASEYLELDWEALIPPEWRPDKLMEEYGVNDLADDDPRALELMDKLQALWKDAPVVPSLDGKRIRLPGFVVPLETDAESVGEFLLVPYYGACIHVPPPPPNQTVHVVTAKGGEYHGELFDTVWVNGTLKVQPLSSELGDAGYRIDAVRVDRYEGEVGPQ
jgi:hypothetical protein